MSNATHAFLAFARDGVAVVAVADPSAPELVATIPLPYASALALDGVTLYVACGSAGLFMVDVSEPSQPLISSTVYNPTPAVLDVFINNNEAYLATADGLVVLNKADLSVIATYPQFSGFMHGTGDLLACSGTGAVLLDVSQPSAIVQVAAYGQGYVSGIAFARGILFIGRRNSVELVDMSTPATPQPLGALSADDFATDFVVDGDRIYIAQTGGKLSVYDFSTPANAQLLGEWSTSGYARKLSVHGTLAAVAEYHSGLRLIDVTDASAPTQLGALERFSDVRSALVTNESLVLFAKPDLVLLNAQTREVETRVALVDAYGAVAHAGRIFVANGATGVGVFDAASLTSLGTLPVPSYAPTVAVSGGVIYVASSQTSTVYTFDMNTLDALNSYALPFIAHDLFFEQSTVLIASEDTVARFALPDLAAVEGHSAAGAGWRILPVGDLIVSSTYGRVVAVNAADLSPAWSAPLTADPNAEGVPTAVLVGDRLFASFRDSLSLLDPATGEIRDSVQLEAEAYSLEAYGPYLVVPHGSGGFTVLDTRVTFPE